MPRWTGVVEGFYGRLWTDAERRALLDVMGPRGLNTYLYAPKSDPKHRLRWRELYSGPELEALAALVAHASRCGVTFWYAIAPGLDLKPSSAEDARALNGKLAQLREAGVEHFALLLDDIALKLPDGEDAAFVADTALQGSQRDALALGRAHAHITNRMLESLPADAPCMVCPTHYWGMPFAQSEQNPGRIYLRALCDGLNKKVALMYTGPAVVPPVIDGAFASALKAFVGERPLVLWDNYPVNDYEPERPLLRPLIGRDARIAESFDGLLANPADDLWGCWLALSTCFDFFRRPAEYDPDTSLRAAASELFPDVALQSDLLQVVLQGPVGLLHMRAAPQSVRDAAARLGAGDGAPLVRWARQFEQAASRVQAALDDRAQHRGLLPLLHLTRAFAVSQAAVAAADVDPVHATATARAFERLAWPALRAAELEKRVREVREQYGPAEREAIDRAHGHWEEARGSLSGEERFFFSPDVERVRAAERALTAALRAHQARCVPQLDVEALRAQAKKHRAWFWRI